jgi:dihydroorotate dehydrogenase electron transfer subunit
MIPRRDLSAHVTARSELSPTCFRLVLEVDGPVTAEPGQFAMLSCSTGLDPLLRRAFSLAGVRPKRGSSELEFLIKVVGRGTSALRALPIGSALKALTPLGNGFTLDPGEAPLALIAGGIGLPPVLFAAERLAVRGVRFDLFAGATRAAELLEVDRCAAAADRVGGRLILATDDGGRGQRGFVTDVLAAEVAGGRRYLRVLACGPDPMLEAVARVAREFTLSAELSLEEPMACGMGVCLGCVVELADGSLVPSCREGPVFRADVLASRRWE